MKTNGNDYKDMLNMMSESVFPIKTDYNGGNVESFGLSKREHFAAMAMQGLLANPDNLDYTRDETAILAIGAADALIKALN